MTRQLNESLDGLKSLDLFEEIILKPKRNTLAFSVAEELMEVLPEKGYSATREHNSSEVIYKFIHTQKIQEDRR